MNLPHFPTVKNARLTSHYGMRTHPISGKRSLHSGTDYAPPKPGQTGVPIYATQSGVVRRANYHATMGNYIYLQHTSDTYTSVYMHLARLQVKEGQKVWKGQQIGIMGTTGSSTGIHLHFMVATSYPPYHTGQNLVNPVDYLKGGVTMLDEDGILGSKTKEAGIRFLQRLFKTPEDGQISKVSPLVKKIQKFLNLVNS